MDTRKIEQQLNQIQKQTSPIPQIATATAAIPGLAQTAKSIEGKTNVIQNTTNSIKTTVEATSKKVDGLKEKLDKLSKRLKLPELLSALTFITVLHNAAMLSQNLLVTLGDTISTGLSVIGLKDEDGQPFDINQILGKQVNEFMESILGKEVWTNLTFRWKAANRAYQAAANVVSSVRSIGDSTRLMAEFAAENTGKIGNALKKSGVVLENSFGWMPEQVTPQFAWMQRLQNLDEAASSLSSVVSEVSSVQEELLNIQEQQKEFTKAKEEAIKGIQESAEKSKIASEAPQL